MSILTAWSPFFHSSARMRGRAYFNEGRVQRREPEADELVRADVEGGDTYIVIIRQDEQRADAECTCPQFEQGTYCKHIWATLLAVQQEEGPGISAAELARLRVRAPKARKRAGAGRQPMREAEPEWMGRLSLLRPSMHDDSAGQQSILPTQRQVCYVVLPEASERSHALTVELRQRTPTATGWSKSRPMKIDGATLPTLADTVDRELCALLLGGAPSYAELGGVQPSGNRGEARYRLPAGAWRTLLQRMIATGRCFVAGAEHESGDDQPLHWAGARPWVLWMVGRESSETSEAGEASESSESSESENDEELHVHVELRRGSTDTGDQTLPIEAPQMVLGGVDGIVIWDGHAAPLDDRDALSWVNHFRDEYRRRDEARPLRVPKADVDRFLDRLYMLPQLPELELPEGIGRVPQHVDPVPHLDLFSPGSREAAQALPSSAKNQLVAKVWFAYDGQRVSPAQAGRFVTISSSASRTDGNESETKTESESNTESNTEGDTDEAHGLNPWASGNGNGDSEHADTTETDASANAPPDEGLLIQRNRRAERDAMAQLAAQGLRPLSNADSDTLALASKQMAETVANLLAAGWEVSADRHMVRHAGTPRVSVSSGVDWFELRGQVRYQRADGTTQDVPLPDILAAARAGESMVQLDDGSQGLLPDQWLDDHDLLTAMGQLQKDHLRFRASQAAILDALLGEQELLDVDEPFERLRERLHRFRGVKEIEPAAHFHGELRPYQREGLGWMALLRWFGMGGILADDMGLGKTIQVLAALQMRRDGHDEDEAEAQSATQTHDSTDATLPEREGSKKHRPSLVVAPRSVVFNWVDEAEKFTNDLRVMAYTGSEREALRAAFEDHDLIVTSYGLLRRDIEQLREFEFDYLILDEAQAIKNPQSQAAKSARLLTGHHRLALTGTPVENHLGDLWSIFEFLNPGMLGASTRFSELVRASQQSGGNNGSQSNGKDNSDTLAQISRAMRPFILRRTKKQVLNDLPDKTEQTIACEMEPAQRKIYDELRDYYRSHLLSQLDQIGAGAAGGGHTIGGKAGFMVLEALLRLRQAACHPGLINDRNADDPSAKLDVLMELLEDVVAEGSKALVFSQFTSMLSLVKRRFDERNIRYCYLDGQTRNRREVVHRFQTDPNTQAFLVSLKTGGFGLNLTAAEYVFILDPWWNPAVEQQAIDRTHRIGQTRRVFAYRLICQDTVEQRIIDLQQQKKQIADAIIGGEQHVLSNLTRDDLEQLLS